MTLRPLNDTVIIEPEMELMPVDNDQTVLDVVNRGLIVLPEKNMMMKISNKAKIVSYGPKCHYKFKPDQQIIYDQFADEPYWLGKYRVIKYHYIQAVYEND